MPADAPPAHRAVERWVFVALWLLAFGMLQWSVVRFRVPIVLALTIAAVALAVWVVRGLSVRLDQWSVAALVLGSVGIGLAVPLFSYLPSSGLTLARWLLGASAAVAVVLLSGPWRTQILTHRWAAATAVTAYAAVCIVAIRSDPAPKIDVWVTLQQAADGLAHGRNMYAMEWTGSPGVKDAFTYLPWSSVLTAPGRWLLGDVRWALAVWMILGLVGLWLLGRRTGHQPWTAAAVISILVLAPGTLTQIDQAWTEPMLWCGLVWWAVLVAMGRPGLAIIPLALACASKQHLWVLLPILALWRPFGIRRAIGVGALAGALMLPWFLASPSAFLHDTVTFLVKFHAIRFANTWYLLVLNEFGVELPFWVTGLVVAGILGLALWAVWRRQPPLGEVVRWLALVLLVANLVNKQGFYNQFWLSAALVAVSLVADVVTAPRRRPAPASPSRTSRRSSPAPAGMRRRDLRAQRR